MAQVVENQSRGGQSQPTTVTIDDTLFANQQNQRTVQDRLDAALVAMQQIIDTVDVSFTTIAQAQTQMRQLQAAIRAEARLLKNLVRFTRSTFDAVD